MPDYNFWNDRWRSGQIGFNLEVPHKELVKFVEVLKPHKTVFVPLCGKSVDMIFLLQQGIDVVGVEFSEIAIVDFMKEQNLVLGKTHVNDFVLYHGPGIKIYQGDLFKMKPADLRGITACYDRASMVAFNLAERESYAKFLIQNAKDLEVILSPLLDFGDIAEAGPPFSVTEEELKRFYGERFDLMKLNSTEIPIRESFKQRAAPYEREVTYKFVRKN